MLIEARRFPDSATASSGLRAWRANPRLGSLGEAKATFAQKVALLDAANPDVAAMLAGIRRLNAIRNRLAHNLGTHVTEE